MTPFRGEGVNKAMKDALELAEWIGKARDPSEGVELNEAVKR
jgi:2-polyprenyl-6-methoxyphenol hydroxylase-like FAD-dependent oxidoreductase